MCVHIESNDRDLLVKARLAGNMMERATSGPGFYFLAPITKLDSELSLHHSIDSVLGLQCEKAGWLAETR